MDYSSHYTRLIDRAKAREKPSGYTERHHIIPRCLGGSNRKENIVTLTAPEHFVAHLLLVRINPGHRGLVWAAVGLAKGFSHIHPGRSKNKFYGWIKSEISIVNKGKTFSAETRAKIVAANTGRKHSQETRERISQRQLGGKRKPHSLESRFAISSALKGRKRPSPLPEVCVKLSVALKGKPWTEKRRAAQRANYG